MGQKPFNPNVIHKSETAYVLLSKPDIDVDKVAEFVVKVVLLAK